MAESTTSKSLFFRLLRVALQTEEPAAAGFVPGADEWMDAYREAKRQCVLGIVFEGVKRMREASRSEGAALNLIENLDEDLWLVWIGKAQQIATQNEHLNQQCQQLTGKLAASGKWCRVIKGQATASLYDNPLSRECGDIDVWIVAQEAFDDRGRYSLERNRDALVAMVRRLTNRRDEVMYHHTDFALFSDTQVEVHFTPSWMYSPLHNSRVQTYFKNHMLQMREADTQGSESIGLSLLDPEMDVVYNLLHIFRHVLGEGIGMRQIVDYFFILRRYATYCREAGKSTDLSALLSRLGLRHIARGLMALMHETLGLSADWFIAKPDEALGRWLMGQILLSGNFGHDDKRLEDYDTNQRADRVKWHFWHSFTLIGRFPRETLWDSPWRLWHTLWRKKKAYL